VCDVTGEGGRSSATRSLPEPLRGLSPIAFSVDPPAGASPEADARTSFLLRKARGLGVTTFDVTATLRPERAERLIARAFPEPDPAVSVIIGRSVDSLSRERTSEEAPVEVSDTARTLAASIDRSRRRLAPVRVGVVEWDPSGEEEADRFPKTVFDSIPSLDASGPLWALRLAPDQHSLPEGEQRPTLFGGPFSLLAPELGERFEAQGDPPTGYLIARDPFSEGRLDGSRFATETGLTGPAAPPVDVRRLHQEFDPVLRLGFLTEGHRRTLAQAALQYILHWSWVATAVVPVPVPERLEELLAYASKPPITPEEFARIRSLK